MRSCSAAPAMSLAFVLCFALPCFSANGTIVVAQQISHCLPHSDNELTSYLMLRQVSLGACSSIAEENTAMQLIRSDRATDLAKVLEIRSLEGISLLDDALAYNPRALHFLLFASRDYKKLATKWAKRIHQDMPLLSFYLKTLEQSLRQGIDITEELAVITFYTELTTSIRDLLNAMIVVEEMELAAKRIAWSSGNYGEASSNFSSVLAILRARETELKNAPAHHTKSFVVDDAPTESENSDDEDLDTALEKKKRKCSFADSSLPSKRQKLIKGVCDGCRESNSLYSVDVEDAVHQICSTCLKRHKTNGSCTECKFPLYAHDKREPCPTENCTGHLHSRRRTCNVCESYFPLKKLGAP